MVSADDLAMSPTLSAFFLPLLLVLFSHVSPAHTATVEHDFNITWVWANPDGAFPRPVIGVNNEWPPPQINVTLGDTLIINTLNSLGNESTSLHFHGLFMNGSSHMDGTSSVSQCAISPGSRFRYEFRVSINDASVAYLADITDTRRSTKPAHIGITRTTRPNTPMA